MTAPILVSVIVVTWNGRRFLERCLTSLTRSVTELPGACEIVVVDNGSTDDSAAYVAATFPDVVLLRNETNLGFAAATTKALDSAAGAFIALLNDDTDVEASWLAELYAAIRTDPALGSCAPQVRFLYHPDRINSAGLSIDRSGAAFDRLGGEPIEASEKTPIQVFGPSGSAVLFRRRMLDAVGLYDPRFFAYLEDADHAWRAQRAGWRCLYVPTAVVYHIHSGTSGQGSARKAYWLARNQVWVLARNASMAQLLCYMPWIVSRTLGVATFYLVTRHTLAPMRGTAAGLRGVRQVSQVRRRYPFLALRTFAPLRSPLCDLRLRIRRDRLAKR